MSEREFSKISGLPVAIQPIASNTIVEIETADGQSFQAPFSALGGMPASHGSTHQDGGSDEIGTEFPTANAIPKADDAGQLTDWIADASTSVKGKVQLAANNESAANKAVQSNDTRMSNARQPTAHAASHLGGTDDLGLGTAALLDVGVADGVCGLDSSGKVSSSNLPSYVDDVIEVANYAALPVTGETGKIYVTLDDNLTYRWTGSAYAEISKSLALGETSSTAYRGDRGKTAYDHSQTAHAPSDADKTQAAINGASGKTTPSDNDLLALLDSDAGNALKKLLWSNVKATLKAYFDTLYTSSGGDTAENILSKLLTVDGYTSGLVAEDSGKVGGRVAASFVYDEQSIIVGGVFDAFTHSGNFVSYAGEALTNNQPEKNSTIFYDVHVYNQNYASVHAHAVPSNNFYLARKDAGIWSVWSRVQQTRADGACLEISGQDIHTLRPTGCYMGENVANAPNAWWWYFDIKYHGGTGFETIDAISLSTHGLQYRKTIIAGLPSDWTPVFNGVNVGSGWATALGASKYSLGTRVYTSNTLTTGSYTIPEGEYLLRLMLDPASSVELAISISVGGSASFAKFSTTAASGDFPYGMIRSDGNNVSVIRLSGTVKIEMIRIG